MNKPVVLITGASSGIGAACAHALIDTCRLILVARRQERLESLCSELGDGATCIAADLSNREQRASLIEQAHACYDQLDVLINNAGVFSMAATEAVEQDGVDAMFELNVTAPMMLTKQAIPLLRASNQGQVINISSIAAVSDFAECGAYCASKAALEAWSRCLREELRADKIRVSVIAPGATVTEIWGPEPAFDLSKMAKAEDVAAAVASCIHMPLSASVDKLTIMPPGGAF